MNENANESHGKRRRNTPPSFHPFFILLLFAPRFPFVADRFNLIRRRVSAIYFPGPGLWWLPLVEPRLISLTLSIRPCRNRKPSRFHRYERLVITTFDGEEKVIVVDRKSNPCCYFCSEQQSWRFLVLKFEVGEDSSRGSSWNISFRSLIVHDWNMNSKLWLLTILEIQIISWRESSKVEWSWYFFSIIEDWNNWIRKGIKLWLLTIFEIYFLE